MLVWASVHGMPSGHLIPFQTNSNHLAIAPTFNSADVLTGESCCIHSTYTLARAYFRWPDDLGWAPRRTFSASLGWSFSLVSAFALGTHSECDVNTQRSVVMNSFCFRDSRILIHVICRRMPWQWSSYYHNTVTLFDPPRSFSTWKLLEHVLCLGKGELIKLNGAHTYVPC